MEMHNFNIDILMTGKEYYSHLKFAYGLFDFDTYSEKCQEIIEWCQKNCLDEFAIFDTFASYICEGVKDVTVIGFVEEADAVAFKLRWA